MCSGRQSLSHSGEAENWVVAKTWIRSVLVTCGCTKHNFKKEQFIVARWQGGEMADHNQEAECGPEAELD